MKRKKTLLLGAAVLLIAAASLVSVKLFVSASDTNKLDVSLINYENSTITFSSKQKDSVLYISSNGKSAWEEVPGTFSGGTLDLDISWISTAKSYKLYFKGDVSSSVNMVPLPKQSTSLKVKYLPASDKPFSVTGAGNRIVQYRKDGTDEWSLYSDALSNEDISYLKGNGATIYFRLMPVIGTGVNATGERPGKEVAVKITAKKDAPSVNVNGSGFYMALTSKMSYRVCSIDAKGNVLSDNIPWVKVSASKNYMLKDIAPACMLSGTANVTSENVAIQFKTNATSSAQESRVTTIIVPAQRIAPTLEESGASLSYTSSTSCELTVKGAGGKYPYEYAIIDSDDYNAGIFDYEDITWTKIENNKAVSFNNKKAPSGSHIYIRKAAEGNYGDENYAIASKEREITDHAGLSYPGQISAGGVTNISGYAGSINTGDYGISKEFTLYSYTKTTVTGLTFKDVYGNEVGSVAVTSNASKNKSGSGNKAYIITTKITSTEGLDNNIAALGNKLYGTITLANGEKIESTDTTGITLTLYKASKVSNPLAKDKSLYGKYFEHYKTSFDRVYLSNEKEDDAYFKFLIEFGSDDVNAGKVSSISYDGYVLSLKEYKAGSSFDSAEESAYEANPADAMIAYEDYVDDEGDNARRAYVTIHANRFEGSDAITKIGEKVPFIIKLGSGETLYNKVYKNLVKTAVIEDAPMAWTMTEGELTESSTKTNYDDKGNKTGTDTSVVNDIIFTLKKMNSSYNVAVSDVTWNGKSILYSAQVAGDEIVIVLSNAKLNTLSSGTGGSQTANVVIVFSNGYKIDAGCKLTILKKAVKD